MIALVASALLAASTLVAAPAPASPAPVGGAAIARAVLRKLRTVEQVRFVAVKLGPIFAESVLARAADQPNNPFAASMRTAEGKARLKLVLGEEFARAYASQLPELTDALVARPATDLSEADLRAIDGFLDTPAGAHWSVEMVVLRQQSSSMGALIGARGGRSGVGDAQAAVRCAGRVEIGARR